MAKKRSSEKYAVSARWTPILAAGGFTPVPQTFLANFASLQPPLTPSEALLVILVMSFKWGADQPWPSLKTIGTMMGCSTRYVRKLVERLEAVGYIRRTSVQGRTNRYDLSGLFTKLENAVRAKALAAGSDLRMAG